MCGGYYASRVMKVLRAGCLVLRPCDPLTYGTRMETLVTRRIYSKLAHLPSSRDRQLVTLLPSGAFYPPVRPIEMRLRHRTLVASVGTIAVLARAANPILELA
jgi:hypothetical protein